jgi:hypothetical protein
LHLHACGAALFANGAISTFEPVAVKGEAALADIPLRHHAFKGIHFTMKTTLALAAGLLIAGTTISAAKTFEITITNKTKSIVETFYASPAGVTNWEEDLFGDKALAPGQKLKVSFSDERGVCDYDFLFEFRGDRLEDLTDTIDLCKFDSYEISE